MSMQPHVGSYQGQAPAAGIGFDCVASHHMSPFRSGVARFNKILAELAGVPFVSAFDERLGGELRRPLFSFKVGEMSATEQAALARLLEALGGAGWCVYLHAVDGLELERRMARDADVIYCGNAEVVEWARPLNERTRAVWTPGLILDTRRFDPARVSVFSFGMAHKLRTDMFTRLRDLLEAGGDSYAVYISNATHETATLEDAQAVYDEMHRIFPRGLYFMGNLSDVAVFNYVLETTFFAAFFKDGVRANNTSVASAMEHGAVVITNLDRHSPEWLMHMDNVLDIKRLDELPSDPLVLSRLRTRAMETARERTWQRLIDAMSQPRTA